MRLNAMKKCAVGAMLVGGALGGTAGARAAGTFTWLDADPARPTTDPSTIYGFFSDSNSLSGEYVASGVATFAGTQSAGSVSWAGASVSWTASGASGDFTLTNIADGLPPNISFVSLAYRWFRVTGGPVTINVTKGGTDAASAVQWDIYSQDLSYSVTNYGPVYDSQNVTLQAGIYNVRLMGGGSSTSGTQFATFTVPAPGAFALLGAAGFVGKRRRR